MAVEILVTDEQLRVQGDPLATWTELECTLKFNEPAEGQLSIPATSDAAAQLIEGCRIVVIRDGAIWCAGPMEDRRFSWAIDGEQDPGVFTCSFSDDLAKVAGRQTYPAPASAFASQVTASDDVRTFGTVNAEVIIRTLVNESCGPGALAARQIPQLVLDSLTSVGTNTSLTTRLEPLLDVCRTVASKDGLGFRTRQDGTAIKFGVYAPVDRSATCRFSRDLGNLRAIESTLGAPLATSELVLGGEEGAREYVEVTNAGAAADWYRVEKLVDSSGTYDTGGELTQAGTAALLEDNPQASLTVAAIDTADLRVGVDFFVGDKVSVVPLPGVEVKDVVRTITLTASPDGGDVVTLAVGTQDVTTSLNTVRAVRDLNRRLGRLEARR